VRFVAAILFPTLTRSYSNRPERNLAVRGGYREPVSFIVHAGIRVQLAVVDRADGFDDFDVSLHQRMKALEAPSRTGSTVSPPGRLKILRDRRVHGFYAGLFLAPSTSFPGSDSTWVVSPEKERL
jgi:hypothetical protein